MYCIVFFLLAFSPRVMCRQWPNPKGVSHYVQYTGQVRKIPMPLEPKPKLRAEVTGMGDVTFDKPKTISETKQWEVVKDAGEVIEKLAEVANAGFDAQDNYEKAKATLENYEKGTTTLEDRNKELSSQFHDIGFQSATKIKESVHQLLIPPRVRVITNSMKLCQQTPKPDFGDSLGIEELDEWLSPGSWIMAVKTCNGGVSKECSILLEESALYDPFGSNQGGYLTDRYEFGFSSTNQCIYNRIQWNYEDCQNFNFCDLYDCPEESCNDICDDKYDTVHCGDHLAHMSTYKNRGCKAVPASDLCILDPGTENEWIDFSLSQFTQIMDNEVEDVCIFEVDIDGVSESCRLDDYADLSDLDKLIDEVMSSDSNSITPASNGPIDTVLQIISNPSGPLFIPVVAGTAAVLAVCCYCCALFRCMTSGRRSSSGAVSYEMSRASNRV